MTGIYLSGATIAALALVVIAVVMFMRYNRNTIWFVISFFVLGMGGLSFVYFGLYSKAPALDVQQRIENKLDELNRIQQQMAEKKKSVQQEIDLIYERNSELIEKYHAILSRDSTLTYQRALVDVEISGILKLLQHNVANIDHLTVVAKYIDAQVSAIELNLTVVRANVVEWRSRGGIDGDLESHLIEEDLTEDIVKYTGKINIAGSYKDHIRTLREIWDALNKNTL